MGLFSKFKEKAVEKVTGKMASYIPLSKPPEDEFAYLDHSVSMGWTTGYFYDLGLHGPMPNQKILIPFKNAQQNFCSFGETGGGKTSAFMLPLFLDLITARSPVKYKNDNDEVVQGWERFGGLVFDIKSDLIFKLQKICNNVDREMKVIGVKPGQFKLNLLEGLNPSQATDYLKSAYLLDGNKDSIDFWLKSALNLTEEALKILIYTSDYTLRGLYQLIFVADKQTELLAEAKENHGNLMEEDIDFTNAIYYFEKTFKTMPDNLRGSIEGSLLPILKPFQGAELSKIFCNKDADDNYDLKEILNSGDLVILDLLLIDYAEAGRTIYTIIKLKFYQLVQSRFDPARGLNDSRKVFLLIDEAQDLLAAASSAGLNDATFVAKSRSQNCIVAIASQSYSAILNAFGQNENQTNTFLANFVNKIIFKLTDAKTIKYIQELIGKREMQKTSYNSGTSHRNFFDGPTQNQGYSVSTQDKYIVDAELINSLGVIEQYEDGELRTAFATLNIDGNTCSDVIAVHGWFL